MTFEPLIQFQFASTFLVQMLHINTYFQAPTNQLFFPPLLLGTLLWIKFSSSMTDPTGSFSVVHFWSDYSDQRRMEQSTSFHLWCSFVSCCLKMPEPVCRQIHFFPSVIQTRHICSQISEWGTVGRERCLRFLSLLVMNWVKMKGMWTEITALLLRFYEDRCEKILGSNSQTSVMKACWLMM